MHQTRPCGEAPGVDSLLFGSCGAAGDHREYVVEDGGDLGVENLFDGASAWLMWCQSGSATIVTVPAFPSTVIIAPFGMMSVALATEATQGTPNSRDTIIA